MQAAIKLILATSVLTAQASACTVCDTGTGTAVRAGISREFWENLGMVMAPFFGTFLVLALVSVLAPKLLGSAGQCIRPAKTDQA